MPSKRTISTGSRPARRASSSRRRRPLRTAGSSARAPSSLHRRGVRGHALDGGERLDRRPHAGEARRRESLHGDRLEERLEPEPADRARPAAGRQDVVPAGCVVAARNGRARRRRTPRRRCESAARALRRRRAGRRAPVRCARPRRARASRSSPSTIPQTASRPCSACAASSSSAMCGSPPRPSTTTTSDGPAGRSIATSRETMSFASFTYALPGPTILSTRPIVSVPYASAAIACGPPTAHTSSTPRSSAAAATSPLPPGGVTTTIRSTPAACAGTAHMTSVETSPRGT